MYNKKSTPMQDYYAGTSGSWFPPNPNGYFTLLGANHRKQELTAQKKKQEMETAMAGVRARNQKLKELPQEKETKKSFWNLFGR